MHERLVTIANLKKDWDSYGGKTCSPEVINTVQEFIDQLPEWAKKCNIVPHTYGGIQVEWYGNDYTSLEIEFLNKDSERKASYLLCPERDDNTWIEEELEYEGDFEPFNKLVNQYGKLAGLI